MLVGCSLNSGRYNSERYNKVKTLPEFKPQISMKTIWNRSVGKGQGRGGLSLKPVIDSDIIYAVSCDGELVACNRYNGKLLWSKSLDTSISGGLGFNNELLALVTRKGKLIVLDKNNGAEKWSFQLHSTALSEPVMQGNSLFVQSVDGTVTALDLSKGVQIWQKTTVAPLVSLRGSATPLVKQDALLIGLSTGEISVLRLKTGDEIWRKYISQPQGFSEYSRMSDVNTQPIWIKDTLYVINFQGNLAALDPWTGNEKWIQKASSYCQLAEGSGNIYFSSETGGLHAINADSGVLSWNQLTDYKAHHLGSPQTIDSSWVFVGDNLGYLHVFSQKTGAIVGRTLLKASIRLKPLVEDEYVYIFADQGQLIALKINEAS